MGTATDIKGQEVSLLVSRDGQLEDSLTDHMSFNNELQFEIKSTGYLGEKTDRKDYYFKGAKFDDTLHLHAQDWFFYENEMISKAQRTTPDSVFDYTCVLNFPNGDTPAVLYNDCAFGPTSKQIASRGDYVTVKLSGECSNVVNQTS